MKKIGIIRESRSDDKRTPLTPSHIKKLLNKYSSLKIIVQPSKRRCHHDQEYLEQGAIINEDLNECDIILGVKEIDPSLLILSKSYMFFSHTSKIQPDNSVAPQGTPGMDKKELLHEILKKNITLIDYENIRDDLSRRYFGFGRFAGIVGCYNSLNLYLEMIGKESMPRAYQLDSYEKLKEHIMHQDFQCAKIIVTGDGRVAKGTLEFLEFANINQITENEFKTYNHSTAVFCNLPTSKYVKRKDDKEFDLQHFIQFPDMYVSVLENFLPYATMLISSHYWDPNSPKLFEKQNIQQYYQLKVIGDITCDINGSIPTTLRSSTIKNPNYYIDRITHKEVEINTNSLAIMAVDNLPSELPKDSSKEFGDGIVKEVFPFLLEEDDGRIKKATITKNGKFCSPYEFLINYINA